MQGGPTKAARKILPDGATAEEETPSDAADEAENGPEEDAAEVVIEEDGGIGGSGIYPPKPIPEQVGGERPADVLVPVDYNPETSYPLILQLHGYSSDSEQIDTYFNLSAYVSSRQFVLITPDGKTDLEGNQYWNAPDQGKYDEGDDDIAYLTGLITEAEELLSIDTDRIYIVGLSNGGFMAHFLACSRPDLIRGIASLAGQAPSEPEQCQPDEGVSMLQIHEPWTRLSPTTAHSCSAALRKPSTCGWGTTAVMGILPVRKHRRTTIIWSRAQRHPKSPIRIARPAALSVYGPSRAADMSPSLIPT